MELAAQVQNLNGDVLISCGAWERYESNYTISSYG